MKSNTRLVMTAVRVKRGAGFLLRCELDAAFFHLYLGPSPDWQKQPESLTRAFPRPRHAVAYIMDAFPIVKLKDETKHGHYGPKNPSSKSTTPSVKRCRLASPTKPC